MTAYFLDKIKPFERYLAQIIKNSYIKQLNDNSSEPIEYFINIQGKRIRPLCCMVSHAMFSESESEALPLASAIELFHNFTLIHDDIMDNSLLRRNQKTVHAKYNNSTAILCGDAMMILAYQELSKLNSDKYFEISNLFNRTAIEVCCGQQYDIDYESNDFIGINQYLNMIKLKTSVLLATSFASGAILGNCSEEVATLLYDFGLNIGLAFQIKDDYLDTFGEVDKIGKEVGGDIMMNKKTFLSVTLMEKLKDQGKTKEVQNILDTTKGNEKIAKITELYIRYNIEAETEKIIQQYLSKAEHLYHSLNIVESKKRRLWDIVELLKNRAK